MIWLKTSDKLPEVDKPVLVWSSGCPWIAWIVLMTDNSKRWRTDALVAELDTFPCWAEIDEPEGPKNE